MIIQSVIEKVNNWGRWEPEDELGTLNYITPDKRVRVAQLVRRGVRFSLLLPGAGPILFSRAVGAAPFDGSTSCHA